MDAVTCLENISNTSLVALKLKYCLVDKDKRPYRIDGKLARPNDKDDFVDFIDLFKADNLFEYSGVGISIQASGICGIDVDECFSIPFDINSIDDRGRTVLQMFEKIAYCEFSFSGKGLRILFKTNLIENYSDKYYIKNSVYKIEYYQPSSSYRYVTITGKVISDIQSSNSSLIFETLLKFLNIYMLKKIKHVSEVKLEIRRDERTIEQLLVEVKKLYFKNNTFQNRWFGIAPGSGKNESELDYQLLALLFENITTDKNKLRVLFESSPYYKTKDRHHIYKWEYSEYRYFNYMYDRLK